MTRGNIFSFNVQRGEKEITWLQTQKKQGEDWGTSENHNSQRKLQRQGHQRKSPRKKGKGDLVWHDTISFPFKKIEGKIRKNRRLLYSKFQKPLGASLQVFLIPFLFLHTSQSGIHLKLKSMQLICKGLTSCLWLLPSYFPTISPPSPSHNGVPAVPLTHQPQGHLCRHYYLCWSAFPLKSGMAHLISSFRSLFKYCLISGLPWLPYLKIISPVNFYPVTQCLAFLHSTQPPHNVFVLRALSH